jgi:hypothetical protein
VSGTVSFVAKLNASGAVTEQDVYNTAGQVIMRYNGSGGWLEGEVWAEGNHLAIYANGQTYFPLTDQVGTERARFSYTGGIVQAESDFKSLAGHEEIRGPVRVKELPDGRRAVLRSDPSTWSTDGRPTIELQHKRRRPMGAFGGVVLQLDSADSPAITIPTPTAG